MLHHTSAGRPLSTRGCSHVSPAGGGSGFHLPGAVPAVVADAGAGGGMAAAAAAAGWVGCGVGPAVGLPLLVLLPALVGGLLGTAVDGSRVGVGVGVSEPPRLCLAAAGAAAASRETTATITAT